MSSSYVILIPDRLRPPADIEQEIFGVGAEIICGEAERAEQISDSTWARCDAVLAWHEIQFDKELLAKMKNCKVIVRVGVGFDNVDLETARQLDMLVCNVPDYGTNDVADHAMALLLQLERGVPRYHRAVMENRWLWEEAPDLRRLTDRVMGIIGFGRIGKAVALRAKAFGIQVVFYDPYVPEGIDKTFQVKRVRDLSHLARVSDYVSIHTPLTPETRGMLNHEFFENCRSGMTLINTARGPIVEMTSLFEALKSNRVRQAGMDVLPEEPPDASNPVFAALQADEPWLRGRIVLTPHAAFYNKESYEEMRRKAAEEAMRVLEREPPLSLVW